MRIRSLRSLSALLVLGALLSLTAATARANVTPNTLFSDGAVLQRGIRLPVWGTANEGEKVAVTFQNQLEVTTAKNGQWQVMLKPLKAGGPFTMTIVGNNTLTLKNVLVGEVWVCSGQSNMELPLSVVANAQEAIAASTDPMLRLFTVKKATSDEPVHTLDGAWAEASPQTVPGFSAVGYYFGRDLRKALGVPVGLIHTSWGGTPAEAWTSREMLDGDSALHSILDDYAKARERYQHNIAAYPAAVEQAKADGKPEPKPPYNPQNQNRPAALYNAMIVPIVPYAIKGVIWYQGEANAERAYQYQTLLPTMIKCWRQAWGEGDFGFLIVQLAPFGAINPNQHESGWAELREAQRLTTQRVPNTGLTVITDVGDEKNVHPRRKEPVGARLALSALSVVYHQKVVASGPTYDSMQAQGNRIVVKFKNVGGGLIAQGGDLTGFAVAGEDHKFFNAQAQIKGNTVIVSSPQVMRPVAARFGWADYPVVNLYNKEGLPASPFRTDDFLLTTNKTGRLRFVTKFVMICLGAILGAGLRLLLGDIAAKRTAAATAFSWGTFLINVTGAFVLGLFMTLSRQTGWTNHWRLLIAIGFLGAYTLLSTFEWKSIRLLMQGSAGLGMRNLVRSVVAGLVAIALGMVTARLLGA